MSSEDQNVLTHTKKLGNSEFSVYCKSLPQTAQLIYNIQKYLSKYDSFYWNSILIINKGRTIQTLTKRLQKQYESLINQKSFLHLIKKALNSREICIEKIKRQLSKVSSILKIFKKVYFKAGNSNDSAYIDYVHEEGYSAVQVDESIQNSIKLINSIFVDMVRLRDMTIYIVETIHNWKKQIQQWSDKCNQYKEVFFIHNKSNVYQIILKDTSFIWQSQLSGYIWLQFKNDPFLIRNVLQVQQKQQKQVLQKYFTEILYPKKVQSINRAVKSFQLLSFRYEPKIQNLYAQQEQLIQSYLKIQKQQLDQEGVKLNNKTNTQNSNNKVLQWQDREQNSTKKNNRLKANEKGWVFGNLLQKPSRERVQSIIQKHQHRMTLIKPFNIANFPQRKTLALAFIDNLKRDVINQNEKKQLKIVKINQSSKFTQDRKQKQFDYDKGYKSQNDTQYKISKAKSLNKYNQIILQDPHEDQPQTPNRKKQTLIQQKESEIYKNKSTRPHSLKKIKVNSFFKSQSQKQKNKSIQKVVFLQKQQINSKNATTLNQSENFQQKFLTVQSTNIQNNKQMQNKNNPNSYLQKIDVDNQETQLNFSQFLTTFRADTNKKMYKSEDQQQKKTKLKQNQQKLKHVRQLITVHRRKGGKSLTHLGKKTFSKQKLINKQIALNFSPYVKSSFLNKKNKKTINNSSILSEKIINQYQQILPNNTTDILPVPSQISLKKFQIDEFIILKTKTVPIDTLPKYLRHIFSQQHSTSKKFTLYNLENLLKKLSDPSIHCLIYDVFTQKRGHIGQAILIQNIGTSQKLKYTFQFLNIHIFQLIVASITRIAEQLLISTPCDQVICPFHIDKLDYVSLHFVSLIEQSFKQKVKAFGRINIYEKKRIYFQGSDVYERMYIFSSNKKNSTQLSRKVLGNYRSLKFQCKCLVLTSNFRLRGKTVAKDAISSYTQTSNGQLYRKIFQKILTKYHLKQIRTATLSISEEDQTVSMVKQNVFLRSLIQNLSSHLKQNKQQKIQITRFETMSQVLSYIDYKGYSKEFYFAAFNESRFILNHQLYLAELQIQLSLEFMIKMSVDFLILQNNHNLSVFKMGSQVSQNQAYFLPTTESDIQLLIMNGKQYEEYSQKLDLFSYLQMILNQHRNQISQINNVKEILIPNIKKSKTFLSGVKMFDGFFRLFPQRQFYSGSFLKVSNLWESYFPSAIIEKPSQNAITFQYPYILGFYKSNTKQILSAFLVKEETML